VRYRLFRRASACVDVACDAVVSGEIARKRVDDILGVARGDATTSILWRRRLPGGERERRRAMCHSVTNRGGMSGECEQAVNIPEGTTGVSGRVAGSRVCEQSCSWRVVAGLPLIWRLFACQAVPVMK